METEIFDDLRQFIEAAKKVSEWREIKGADWDLEIGALIEATAELIPQPPMLLFDEIKGYPPGFRVLGLPFASYKRVALALGLPPDRSKLELVRLAAQKIRAVRPIPPKEVSRAPVTENVMTGAEVDLFRFPALRSHEGDGGRYIGTGDALINAEPESGFINMGTYRMQLHDRNLLGLWMSPGQHGRMICMKYWEKGKSCPVVAIFGQDPLTFMAANAKLPWGQSELAHVGGLRGRPLIPSEQPHTGRRGAFMAWGAQDGFELTGRPFVGPVGKRWGSGRYRRLQSYELSLGGSRQTALRRPRKTGGAGGDCRLCVCQER